MIICNFQDDLREYIIKSFLANNCINWDPNKSFDDLLMDYSNWRIRIILDKKRKIVMSPIINPPHEHFEGCMSLIKLIVNGDNINPYLSDKIRDIKYQDKMLYDWGIYHFHLGNRKPNGTIARTNILLFARVTDSHVYFIQYLKHGEWHNTELIEAIHQYWPDTIADRRIRNVHDIEPKLDGTIRHTLRKKNVNSLYQTTDGTVYAMLGGGLSTAGTSSYATLWAIKLMKDIESKERYFDQNSESIMKMLVEKGQAGNQDVRCCWDVENDEYLIRNLSGNGSLGNEVLLRMNFK